MFFDQKNERTTRPEECKRKIKQLDAFSHDIISKLQQVKLLLDQISEEVKSKIHSNLNKAGFIFSDVESDLVKLDIGEHIEDLKLKF